MIIIRCITVLTANQTLTTPPTHRSRFLFMMSVKTETNTKCLKQKKNPLVNQSWSSQLTNLPMNSWWEFLQWRNMGSFVSSAKSNCFSKYLQEWKETMRKIQMNLTSVVTLDLPHTFDFFLKKGQKHLLVSVSLVWGVVPFSLCLV